MTPSESMKKYCNWCSGNSPEEASKCVDKTCPFFTIRNQAFIDEDKEIREKLAACKKMCFTCFGFEKDGPSQCNEKKCAIFRFRYGTLSGKKVGQRRLGK